MLKGRLEKLFHTKTRDEWCALMEGTDACFAPVLTMSEAAEHPHNVARETFIDVAGTRQPAPAPRFSRTRPEVARPPAHAGQHTREVLLDWGLAADVVDGLFASGSGSSRRMATLVCLHAHPDDEALSTGGTMARAKAEGHRVGAGRGHERRAR